MSDLTRSFVSDISVRSDGRGRTIVGIVAPFGVSARVSDGGAPYNEMFQRGAFTKTLNDRGDRPVKLLSQHESRAHPLGSSLLMREDTAGLYGEFKVSNTRAGNDALELVRDGALDSFSVGFTPIKATKKGDTTVRTEVALREASLVTFGAYPDALITGIRSLSPEESALAHELLNSLTIAGTQLDPIVEALCATDGAIDQAQAVISQILSIPNPDAAEMGDMAGMSMSDNLVSLARRLDEAIAARSSTPTGAATDEPQKHSGRLIVARNTFRAALIERGIRA